MHALPHSLAHRGPGASSRARTRFQPYSSQLASTPSSRSPQSYLHTPVSVSSSSTPSTSYISPLSQIERSRKPSVSHAASSLSQLGQFREAQKNKYVTRLVDQAVNSLCDIWKPEDIPQVFRTTSQTAYSAPMPCEVPMSECDAPPTTAACTQWNQNNQLPSPISPSTRPSPISISPLTPSVSMSPDTVRSNHLIPIRGFVHEVLRRSRTSTGVLQTALCYLEAVRAKVPEHLQKEKAKTSSKYVEEEQDPSTRITLGTLVDLEDSSTLVDEPTAHPGACRVLGSDFMDVENITVDPSILGPPTAPLTELLFSMDGPEQDAPPTQATLKKPSAPLPPLPPLPSPLLCPRRTFLACLILASKFMQDRSYSNRAWAKLAGLPPREIGSCERALGEALEWRLWVGKGPAPASVPAPCAGAPKAVTRCRSEATLKIPTCGWSTSPAALYAVHSGITSLPPKQSGLRRSSTMPNIGSNEPFLVPDGQSHADKAVFSATYHSRSSFASTSSAFSDTTTRLGSFTSSATQWFNTGMQTPSPSLSTPSLTYSPASTTSSEDYERTIQISSVVDMPVDSKVGSFEISAKPSSFEDLPRIFKASRPDLKLPAFEPMVVNAPVELPPLSEAVSNPVLVERALGSVPRPDNILGTLGQESFNGFATWSVLSHS